MLEAQTLFIAKLPTFHTWVTIALVALAMVSYSIEKISMEITSMLVIVVFMLFFHFFPLIGPSGSIILNPDSFLLGFANPALVSIVSLLIIGQAIIQSNALNIIPNFILKLSKNSATLAIFMSYITVIVISAFMNNTPLVVIFIPILAELCRSLNISPSKVMMPLSFAAILGGMTTLIGSSTNLLISGAVSDLGLRPLGFFEFAIPGSIMAGVGLFYVMTVLPKILPDHASSDNNFDDDKVFVSQIYIGDTNDFAGKRLVEGYLPGFPEITIRVIEREGRTLLAPFQDSMEIKEKDVLVVSAPRKALAGLLYKKPHIFVKNMHIDELENKGELKVSVKEANIAELVITPSSRMIGETIKTAGFFNKHHCPVIGIQRNGNMLKSKVTKLRLIAGDVLLVLGETSKIIEMRNSKDIIVTKWSMQQIKSLSRVIKTLLIFFAVITLSALKIMPISIAAFFAVVMLVMTDCINLRQASRAIDLNIVLMITASIAMGIAIQATGAASKIAEGFVTMLHGMSIVGIISSFFIFISIMTNIISNAACAIIFTPIAVNIAIQLGADPMLFVYAIIFACNCSFVTPIGYQTNLLVMSPGKYRFIDFIKAGLPLVVLLSITYALIVTYYFQS